MARPKGSKKCPPQPVMSAWSDKSCQDINNLMGNNCCHKRPGKHHDRVFDRDNTSSSGRDCGCNANGRDLVPFPNKGSSRPVVIYDEGTEEVLPTPSYQSISVPRHIGTCSTKKFHVTFAPARQHPWIGDSGVSIWVNDKEAPCLSMKKGCTYEFIVRQDPVDGVYVHKFFLSMNPGGGGCNGLPIRPIPNSFSPIAQGTVSFTPDETTPVRFYYADTYQAMAGFRCEPRKEKEEA